MDNTIHTIVLADGTRIRAGLNGSDYITGQDINEEIMSEDNLSAFSIDDEEFENYICTNIWAADDGTHFVIRPLTEIESMFRTMDAKFDYIAMMTDVEIPEEEV